VSSSWLVNEVAAEDGAEVVWSKLGTSSLMDLATSTGAHFAANAEGGFAFPSFLPAFDAVATLVHLMTLLAYRDTGLSAILEGLPKVSVVHQRVRTPFELKGTVMRGVLERARGDEVVLIDGVKTIDASGWTLFVPDPEDAITHVYAESDEVGGSFERARRGANEVLDILDESRDARTVDHATESDPV
jgi:mannose-1-phosphate guanylyltransferase/phosphomannomutase